LHGAMPMVLFTCGVCQRNEAEYAVADVIPTLFAPG
jgi:hypothetical protein